MKRLLAVTLGMLLLIAATGNARPAFGVKAGLISSGQTFSDSHFDRGVDDRRFFQFGVFMDYPISRHFSLVPELRYVPIGLKYVFVITTNPPTFETVKTRVDYLSIPLLIKARLPMQTLTPYFIAGPRVDFQLGGTEELTGDRYDKTTAGMTVGGGVQWILSSRYAVLLEMSYSPDITKVYNSGESTIRNRSLSISCGLSF